MPWYLVGRCQRPAHLPLCLGVQGCSARRHPNAAAKLFASAQADVKMASKSSPDVKARPKDFFWSSGIEPPTECTRDQLRIASAMATTRTVEAVGRHVRNRIRAHEAARYHRTSTHPSTPASTHSSIHPYVLPSILPSVCPSVRQFIHPPTRLPCQSTIHHPSIPPSVHPLMHPFFYASIRTSVHPSIQPASHASICPSFIHQPIHPTHPCISPSVHPDIRPSIHSSIHPSVHVSIQLSTHPSLPPSIHSVIRVHLRPSNSQTKFAPFYWPDQDRDRMLAYRAHQKDCHFDAKTGQYVA